MKQYLDTPYFVSESGGIFLDGKEKNTTMSNKGYKMASMYFNSKSNKLSIHRLVAILYVSNPNNLPQVNHMDGNKKNNSVTNLEWMTNSQNQKHAYKLGLQHSKAGENNNKAKITDKDVTLLKQMYNSGMSIVKVSQSMNISISIIRNIIYGISWKSNTTPVLKRDDRFKPIIT